MNEIKKGISKIGIVLEPEVCMGAECNEDGEVELIQNPFFEDYDFEERQGYELEHAAGVKGFETLLDAGIAVSDMGIAMRRILNNQIDIFEPDKSIHAVIAMPSDYPMADHIDMFMDLQKILAPKDKDSKFSRETYEELELENLTSFELVEKAAEYAGIENYKVILRPLAIAYAYEYEYPGCALADGERGLIYDWNKNYFSATIIEKRDNDFDILWMETVDNPAYGDNAFLYYTNEELIKKESYYFLETMEIIHEMCGLSGYYVDTIDNVYLAGDFCNGTNVMGGLLDIFPNVFRMKDNRLAVLHGVARLAQNSWNEEDENEGNHLENEELEAEMMESLENEAVPDLSDRNHTSLIPTLFKFKVGIIAKFENKIEMELARVYDDNIRDKYMQKGNVYNALLPYFETPRSTLYSYSGNSQIDFKLRKKPNNRMLMMKLIGMGEEVSAYEKKCFAYVDFFKPAKKAPKGRIQLNYGLNAYEKLTDLDEKKYLILDDQNKNIQYVFECWIEQLPMPGVDSGIYAYLDGTSNNDTNPEDIAAGYVVNIGTDVYFGRQESNDIGRNVSAEYLAATNVLQNLPAYGEFASITMYFDNINVGYVGAGLYNPDKPFGIRYKKALEDFMEKNPNTKLQFVHTDSHSYIYGNEMADQMAQGKERKLMELAKNFKENREKICPVDGKFSEVMRFVRE